MGGQKKNIQGQKLKKIRTHQPITNTREGKKNIQRAKIIKHPTDQKI